MFAAVGAGRGFGRGEVKSSCCTGTVCVGIDGCAGSEEYVCWTGDAIVGTATVRSKPYSANILSGEREFIVLPDFVVDERLSLFSGVAG